MEKNNGKCYVLGDHITTDDILIAEYMKYNPAIPEEYEKLGSLAMSGLPEGYHEFIGNDGKGLYPIIVAGDNFGCGSSREHAVKALEAAGVRVIIANSFARIFFRNCLNTGKVMLIEKKEIAENNLQTGDEITVDTDKFVFYKKGTDKAIELKAFPTLIANIFNEGGIFNYARTLGKI